MMIKPRCSQIYLNLLARQLKLWRQYKITDAHSLKLLKLWIGHEFTDIMDEFGRYTAPYFNEIRRRLGYAKLEPMLNDIRTCHSFLLVGTSEDNVTAIFSPIWHEYEQEDGLLLQGSFQHSESQTCNQTFDVSINNNNINNATASNDGALFPDGELAGAEEKSGGNSIEISRDVRVRRRIVSDYFKWLVRQPMAEHKALVENLRHRIANPRDKKGKVLTQYCLDEDQTNEVWQVMIEKVFVPYFQTRDEFFKPTYMQHPEKRIWWMTNLIKQFGNKLIVEATKKWRHNRRTIEAESANARIEAQKLYRPHSPHEWEDPDGQRWYMTSKGTKQQIPDGAPPRPSEDASYIYHMNEWR